MINDDYFPTLSHSRLAFAMSISSRSRSDGYFFFLFTISPRKILIPMLENYEEEIFFFLSFSKTFLISGKCQRRDLITIKCIIIFLSPLLLLLLLKCSFYQQKKKKNNITREEDEQHKMFVCAQEIFTRKNLKLIRVEKKGNRKFLLWMVKKRKKVKNREQQQ